MKQAIVLGAVPQSGNIGEAVVDALTEENWDVIGNSCQDGRAGSGYEVPNLDYDSADALVITLGRTAVEPFEEIARMDLEDVIRGCLTLPLAAARWYVQRRIQRGGHIVFIGSYAHRHPFSNGTAYCAAKAGIEMATKTLAWELTGKGFTINCVHPYHVDGTPMWEKVQAGVMETKGMTREQADAYAEKDLKTVRLMKAKEVGEAVAMVLNNPNRDFMSGSSIELFGGTR